MGWRRAPLRRGLNSPTGWTKPFGFSPLAVDRRPRDRAVHWVCARVRPVDVARVDRDPLRVADRRFSAERFLAADEGRFDSASPSPSSFARPIVPPPSIGLRPIFVAPAGVGPVDVFGVDGEVAGVLGTFFDSTPVLPGSTSSSHSPSRVDR